MDQDTGDRIVDLVQEISGKLDGLDQIQSTLDSLDSMVHDLKLELCGFEHEGNRYPSLGDKVDDSIQEIKHELSNINSTLTSIDMNTAG
jgi:hypothetical protein